jgi:hypothetical protein
MANVDKKLYPECCLTRNFEKFSKRGSTEILKIDLSF